MLTSLPPSFFQAPLTGLTASTQQTSEKSIASPALGEMLEQPLLTSMSPADAFTTSASIESMNLPINKLEMTARYTNNMLVHLLASDGAAMLSIAANLTTLPTFLSPLLDGFNALNSVTGVLGIAADLREMHGSFKNENATKKDKMVDMAHFVLGDVVSTLASMVPLVAPLTSPIAMGFFVGGQVLGLAMDVHKCLYDISRKGQQSAASPKKPVADLPAASPAPAVAEPTANLLP